MKRNPWDRPPIPPHGDPHESITYAAIGAFLTQWEMLESELSHLYAIFIGKYFEPEAYDQYYDKSKTFAMRLKSCENAAFIFFTKRPSQADEGDFSELMKRVAGFSERRHEIAHGVVRPYLFYARLTEWSDPMNRDITPTCIAPPHYQRNWFTATHLPKYVYGAPQIDRMTKHLKDLLFDLLKFKHRFASNDDT